MEFDDKIINLNKNKRNLNFMLLYLLVKLEPKLSFFLRNTTIYHNLKRSNHIYHILSSMVHTFSLKMMLQYCVHTTWKVAFINIIHKQSTVVKL